MDTTSKRLTDCAAALWLEAGPGAISFGQVSARTGVQKSLVAYHFPSAARLRLAAAEKICADFQNQARVVAEELSAYSAAEHGASGSRLWAQMTALALRSEHFGLALLEIAFFALDDRAYRRRIHALIAGLRRSRGLLDAESEPVDPRAAFALALGALMTHTARGHGPHHLFALDKDFEEVFRWPALPSHRRWSAPAPPPIERSATDCSPRERILDAAIDLLATDPLRAMSHRALAQQAGLSLSATTYYFSGKSDIFEATLQRLIERAERALTTARTPAPSPPQTLGGLAQMLTDFYLGEGLAETRAHFNIGLLAARTRSMRTSVENLYQLQIVNFRRFAPTLQSPEGKDLIPILYKVVTGHLLLCMIGA